MAIYFDHNATTPLHPKVHEALPTWLSWYANPSSYHSEGRRLNNMLEEARAVLAHHLGAIGHEVIFASGASEVNAWVFRSLVERAQQLHPDRPPRIVVNQTEHPSVIEAADYWSSQGVEIRWWPVDEHGRLDESQASLLLTEGVDGCFLMRVNNETGVIFPVESVAKLCQEQRIRLHCDAVQSLGKLPLDFESIGADTMVVAGHKAYAPKGCAVLVVRRGQTVFPVIHGFQENGKRGGTENLLAVLGLRTALDAILPDLAEHVSRVTSLRNRLAADLQTAIPTLRLNTPLEHAVGNTLNVSFHRLEGQAVMLELDRRGMAVSTGSACHATQNDISHVIRAMAMDPLYERGNIRISLGLPTTQAEIDRLVAVLPQVVESLGVVV